MVLSTPSPCGYGRQGFVPLGLPPVSPVEGERDDLRRFFRRMIADPRRLNEFYVALSQTHLCDPTVRSVMRLTYRTKALPERGFGFGPGYYSLEAVRPWKPPSRVQGLAVLESLCNGLAERRSKLVSERSGLNDYLNVRRNRKCTRAAARIQRAVLSHIYRPGGSMMLRSVRLLDAVLDFAD